MDVNTTEDNPGGPLGDNQVTLRDAINTGNKGGGIGHGNSIEPIRFIDTTQNKGQPLGGTISLKQALPSIQKSYNIVGPGYAALGVSGDNAFRVFAVNAGVTSTISGLNIYNGFLQNDSGAGISNQGNLTLYNDYVYNNQTSRVGGGISNDADAQLSLQQVTFKLYFPRFPYRAP